MKDRAAVVTGPAKELDAACTRLLAKHCADLALVGRDTGATESMASEVRAMGRRAEISACDVTDAARVEKMDAEVLAAFGRCDVLVNIAGGRGPLGKTFWETTPEPFDALLRLNVTGCFLTMRAFAPGWGRMARPAMPAPAPCNLATTTRAILHPRAKPR